MFEIGEYAVYGTNGVCRVSGREERDGIHYYVLVPLGDSTLSIIIPADNNKVRKPAAASDAEALLNSIPQMPDIWSNDVRERRKSFSQIIAAHKQEELACLAKTLYRKKEERRRNGKQMYSFEEGQLKTAEGAVAGEIAYALKITFDEAVTLLEKSFSA